MTMDGIALIIVGVLLAAGLIAILTTNEARRLAPRTKPAATLLYDGAAAGAVPLVAHSLLLQGNPQAILREADGSIIVVLARTGTAPPVAKPSDAIQLAGEMLVAEEALGVTVTGGLLRYQDRALGIPLTPALRALALQRLAELRACDEQGPQLTRQDPVVCRACAYRAMCAIGRINAPSPHSVMG